MLFNIRSIQQSLGRCGWNARPLELPDLTALAVDLKPHALDFSPNVFDVRHGALCENGSRTSEVPAKTITLRFRYRCTCAHKNRI
jgi:hypothetical protein